MTQRLFLPLTQMCAGTTADGIQSYWTYLHFIVVINYTLQQLTSIKAENQKTLQQFVTFNTFCNHVII